MVCRDQKRRELSWVENDGCSAAVRENDALRSSRISIRRPRMVIKRALALSCRQGGMKEGSKINLPEPERTTRATGSVTSSPEGSVSRSSLMFFRPSRTDFSSRPVVSSGRICVSAWNRAASSAGSSRPQFTRRACAVERQERR